MNRRPASDATFMLMRRLLIVLTLVATLAGCGFGSRRSREDPEATLAAIRSAHQAYVEAINSNQVNTWLNSLSDDVVYFVPNQQALVGKEAVATWATRYLQEVTTHWTKPVQEFTVAGDWAFGRYVYTASDSVVIRDPETDGGGTANDSGWGLLVYHREGDGRWRVARDAWGSDRPAR